MACPIVDPLGIVTGRPCCGIPRIFNERVARRELRKYRRAGPRRTTRWLLDVVRGKGVEGCTLLDVGGGVGAIQHEFMAAGGAQVVDVDAAPAYLEAAAREAARRGYADRATYVAGDFVEAADRVPAADYVTLDRVVCCYPDPEALVSRAAQRARRALGLVWPRDRRLARIGRWLANASMWVVRNPFRSYVHADARLESILRRHGFQRTQHRQTTLWQVALYERARPP